MLQGNLFSKPPTSLRFAEARHLLQWLVLGLWHQQDEKYLQMLSTTKESRQSFVPSFYLLLRMPLHLPLLTP
jgi:hypothetical protein